MVYELLCDCFVLNNFVSGFDLFFEVCGHITQGHVPPSVLHLLFTSWFIVLEKQSKGIHLVTIGDVTYRLIAHTLAIEFKVIFAEHFGPH